MKSILHQLDKYRQERKKNELVVPEKTGPTDGIDIGALAEQIVRADYTAGFEDSVSAKQDIARITKLLGSMPHGPMVGILYPHITLARYHLFYNHQYPVGEVACDREIAEFMRDVDINQYRDTYQKACGEAVLKTVLVRCLIATFEAFTNSKDRIPSGLRGTICTKLGISQTTTLGAAIKLQDQSNQYSVFSLEEQILGRFGYIMIWDWINNKQSEDIPLIGHVKDLLT